MKRNLMLILLAILAIAALTVVSANMTKVSATTYSGSCGNNVNYNLDTSTGVLTISGSGSMSDYSHKTYNETFATSAPWGQYRSYVKTITINNGVTSIGNSAFYGCTGLTSITIPDSVTSIGGGAFRDCTKLTRITIPNSVTSIGAGAFEDCTGLTSITIPDSVTSIGNSAFYGCTGLTSITIPDSVTSIGEVAFSYCTGLTSITIPDSVTSIGGSAFYKTVWYNTQPDGLVYAGKVAYEYKGNCPSSVTIKDGTLGIADRAFYGCTELTRIIIPDSVTSIGRNAFYYCNKLKAYVKPNSEAESYIKQAIISYGYCCGNILYTLYNNLATIEGVINNSIESLEIPENVGGSSVVAIYNNAFLECLGLTNITIPDSVTGIGDRAFSGCAGLTSITIPDSVTSVGSEAFSGCTGLTSVLIGDSVSEIGSSAFSGFTGWANTKNNAYAQSYFKSKNIKYTVSYGEENYWGYDPAAKTLYVFGAGRTENYKNVTSTPWTSLATEVKKIVIDDGIEYIGNFSFRNFTSLDYLEKSDGVEFGYNALPDGFKAVNSAVPLSPEISWVTENTVELKAVDGYEYRRGSGSWQTSNVFTGLWEGYSYSFSQRIAETDKYRPSSESASVSVTTVTSPSSVSMTSFTEEALTLSPVGRGEYSLDLVHWQTSNVITDFPNNETFRVWVRIAGTSARKASAPASPVTFVYLTGPEFVEYIDETLRIKEYPGVRCEYSNDGVNWQSESVFTGIPQGVDLDIYIRPVDSSVIYAGGVREFHGEHNDVYETEAILDEALYKVKKCPDCGVILEKTFIKSVFVYGDATGDGVVTAADIVRLKKYVASGNTLAVGKGADANGDGVVDSLDVVRLKNYFASYDYDKKTSPIKLGAQN